jgi:hypothetical protein
MDERGLKLKKSILSRVVRCDDVQVLRVVDLLLERSEDAGAGPDGAELDAILSEVARALCHARGAAN